MDDSGEEDSLDEKELQNIMKPLVEEAKLQKLPSIVTNLEKENISGIKPTSSHSKYKY
jgi:hypothetical protein